ncbi:MAG TPA: hypothetical protein VFC68_02875 [Treponemataceae bacterium]|nr:hypothetical protein [Treponemataceae bacterium]
MKEKRKKNPFFRIVYGVFSFFVVFLLLVGIWIVICLIDCRNAADALPNDFDVYIQTESLWKSVDPLLDLQAVDLVLSDPQFSAYRGLLFSLRASHVRSNYLVKKALSKRVDVTLQLSEVDTSFFAVINMGVLSAVTRVVHSAMPFLKVPGLAYVSSADYSCFEYRIEDKTIYIKPYKNLVLITMDQNLLKEKTKSLVLKEKNTVVRDLLAVKQENPIRIAVHTNRILEYFSNDAPLLKNLQKHAPEDEFGQISFRITDEEISVSVKAPVTTSVTDEAFGTLISTASSLPVLPSKMPQTTQYYTLLNLAPLNELKKSFMPFFPNPKKIDSIWSNAQKMAHLLFSLSLEDLLFSWTGKEIAVFGLAGKKDPIFALEIKNERKRQEIFDVFLSSLIVKDGKNLIYNGVRIPSIDVPRFIQDVLFAFGINLPNPYYLVQDNFIYFSESSENLSEIFFSVSNGKSIFKNENWVAVSKNSFPEFSIGLFYDLQRSVPFFVRNNSLVSQVLKLYNMGRCDLSFNNGKMACILNAHAKRATSNVPVYGFPISLQGVPEKNLISVSSKNAGYVYWLEDQRVLHQLNTKTLEVKKTSFTEKTVITKSSTPKGDIWAVTAQGAVYLINENLETVDDFPILTGQRLKAGCTTLQKSLLYTAHNNTICFVSPEGAVSTVKLPSQSSVLSTPSVYNKTAVAYAKGFIGDVFSFNQTHCFNADTPLTVNGIAYGSPALLESKGNRYSIYNSSRCIDNVV